MRKIEAIGVPVKLPRDQNSRGKYKDWYGKKEKLAGIRREVRVFRNVQWHSKQANKRVATDREINNIQNIPR